MHKPCAELCFPFVDRFVDSLSLENRKRKGLKLTTLDKCCFFVGSFTGNFEYGYVSSSIVECG